MLEKITGMIAGNNDPADYDDPIRDELRDKAFIEEDFEVQQRYLTCSECEFLGNEFKLLGKTIFENTPQCIKCGCLIYKKAPIHMFDCPEGRW